MITLIDVSTETSVSGGYYMYSFQPAEKLLSVSKAAFLGFTARHSTFTPRQWEIVVNAMKTLIPISAPILWRCGLSFNNAVNSADSALSIAMEHMFDNLTRLVHPSKTTPCIHMCDTPTANPAAGSRNFWGKSTSVPAIGLQVTTFVSV